MLGMPLLAHSTRIKLSYPLSYREPERAASPQTHICSQIGNGPLRNGPHHSCPHVCSILQLLKDTGLQLSTATHEMDT